MDITTDTRETGLYVIQAIGMQQWPEGDGAWKAHGVRLDLMDGRTLLTRCKLEVVQAEAEERASAVVEQITPWAEALRRLAAVAEVRSWLARMVSWMTSAEEAETHRWPLEDYVREDLIANATQEEIEQAKASQAHEWAGMPLAKLIAARWRGELAARHRALLAAAPDVATHPIHPAWEQPALYGVTGVSTAQTMARELLTAWAEVRDMRDPLITWAVKEAELTRTQVQQITSVSRSTINRLLPE
ncbi:hypothetical protein [Streptomyces glaucescens]|uniref:hypothetical protein n=1 Tax=Streptomyces glaucescens TaxID=1907 RepID=UPI000A3C044F|nr:hypothetical protein [Streptomyces glaucescens]